MKQILLIELLACISVNSGGYCLSVVSLNLRLLSQNILPLRVDSLFDDSAIETLAEFSQVAIVKIVGLIKFNRSPLPKKQRPPLDTLRGETTTGLG